MPDPRPNLFVIGAAKCGTTFFHDLLSQHPDIFMSAEKELWHFNRPDHADRTESYLANFRDGAQMAWRGESTPIYGEVIAFPDLPADLHAFAPDARIIYLVREPFSRLRSVWAQTVSSGHWAERKHYAGKMPLAYRDAVFSYPTFLDACRYWTTIRAYRDRFGDASIKVVVFEDLIADPDAVLAQVFSFLGVRVGVAIRPNPGKRNGREEKTVYEPVSGRLGRVMPGWLRGILPDGLRRGLKTMVGRISVPKLDDRDLSAEQFERARKLLAPEVRGLYAYLGLQHDPWSFFDGEAAGEAPAQDRRAS